MCLDLNKNWKCTFVNNSSANDEAIDIDLPIDCLRAKNRNYNAPFGEYGSYYDAAAASFCRNLPQLNKCEWAVLEIEGVNQFADVFVNDELVLHIESGGKHFVDIVNYYKFGAKNTLKINVWAPQLAGRYTGAGISGGVKLHVHKSAVALIDDGAYAISQVSGGKAVVSVFADVSDKSGEWTKSRKTLTLEAVLYNAKGKKAARKLKKFKLKCVSVNTTELKFRLSRYYTWSVSDPYTYTLKLSLLDDAGNKIDEVDPVTVGIVSRALSHTRGIVLGGRGVKLKGAVMAHDNGILGMESTFAAEEYKLSKIKEIGYNAVRYVRVPSEAALSALDKIGLMAVVDIFDSWSSGEFPYDGHTRFATDYAAITERAICTLRKHPSVVAYGLCDNADETYGRGGGKETAEALAQAVRKLDPSRPIVVNARERVPLKSELDGAGIKMGKAEGANALISLGREKDLFGNLTADTFSVGDIAGYSYLYPRYSSDRTKFPDRLIMGSAAYSPKAFEAFEECDKNSHVVGEFLYSGADYLGYPLGKPAYEEEGYKFVPPHASYCGDLDLIYEVKPSAYYHKILLGDRSESVITVTDPETTQKPTVGDHTVKETHSVWNWPRSLGKPIEVEVYSGGEVVALYRDGRLIGRKLAGMINKHIATFKTEYYPGKLEAISYHKGRECSRTCLESASSPRAVKLSCERKSKNVGELMFVQIAVTDRDGRLVPYASREVEISVTGAGELYALGSADRECKHVTSGITMCPVYEGKALAVIKATGGEDGRITVKATCDGLLSGKINLRVKDKA